MSEGFGHEIQKNLPSAKIIPVSKTYQEKSAVI